MLHNIVNTSQPKSYLVQQGMINVRDKQIGWRDWEICSDLAEARKVARNLVTHPDGRCGGGIARILEVRELQCFHDGCLSTIDAA